MLRHLPPVLDPHALVGAALADDVPAKTLFGAVAKPSAAAPLPIGSFAKGCLAGAVPLPVTGPAWQVMRLSRNRNWGTPELVSFLEKLGTAGRKNDWPGLLVGDMSQPRGGPMATGHASHQIGLDADIWFVPMPDHVLSAAERESMAAESLLIKGRLAVDPAKWSDAYAHLLKRAASYPEVTRIFVSAAIKQQLCDTAGTDRDWLRKLRPWAGHADHFHVRLQCPLGQLHPARRVRADQPGHLQRRWHQLAGRDDAVDQPGAFGLRRIHHPTGVGELGRDGGADEPRQ